MKSFIEGLQWPQKNLWQRWPVSLRVNAKSWRWILWGEPRVWVEPNRSVALAEYTAQERSKRYVGLRF